MIYIYSILSLRNLEQLDVKGSSRMKRLPQELGNLQSLKQLNVSKCDLKALPDRWVEEVSKYGNGFSSNVCLPM